MQPNFFKWTWIAILKDGTSIQNYKDGKEQLFRLVLDAEKEDYLEFFHLIFPKLKIGGIIVADNVISHAEDLKEYVDFVRANPDTQSLLVPIGRGE